MLFGPFGRELLCFEYLDISLDLTGICRGKILAITCLFVVVNSRCIAVLLIY